FRHHATVVGRTAIGSLRVPPRSVKPVSSSLDPRAARAPPGRGRTTMSTPENSGALDSALAATEAADKPRLTSVGKALRLLAAFRGLTPPVGVSELARRSGLPKSTAFRFLADLEEVGFVERVGANYRLGLALFGLGSRVTICRP